MASKKFDGVVEAVRYAPDGNIALARVYERRGPTFSDRVLLSRDDLIERIKAKKRFYIGRRTPYLASTFETGDQMVTLAGDSGKEVIRVGKGAGQNDLLEGAPLF
jgi:hypothetical protein